MLGLVGPAAGVGAASNSPFFMPPTNVRHSASPKIRIPPSLFLLSRTAQSP
jgi:hypothetical protein